MSVTSLLIWKPFILFIYFCCCCLIADARSSGAMCSSGGESAQPCRVPDLRGNGLSFSPLIIVAVGSIMVLKLLWY